MTFSTITTPPALAAYRSRHTVKAVRDWAEDFNGYVSVCETDAIRVHQEADGGWRHDASEIAQLAAFERGWKIGDPVDWR